MVRLEIGDASPMLDDQDRLKLVDAELEEPDE
jgi:hypothetical protein